MKEKMALIVAEDEAIVESIADDLLDYNLEAISASDLNEAHNLIKKFRKDIAMVLCDFDIDEGNGLALKEFLLEENYKIPFILLVDDLTDSLEDDARRLGIRDVIVKPVDIELVREIVEEILEVA